MAVDATVVGPVELDGHEHQEFATRGAGKVDRDLGVPSSSQLFELELLEVDRVFAMLGGYEDTRSGGPDRAVCQPGLDDDHHPHDQRQDDQHHHAQCDWGF